MDGWLCFLSGKFFPALLFCFHFLKKIMQHHNNFIFKLDLNLNKSNHIMQHCCAYIEFWFIKIQIGLNDILVYMEVRQNAYLTSLVNIVIAVFVLMLRCVDEIWSMLTYFHGLCRLLKYGWSQRMTTIICILYFVDC